MGIEFTLKPVDGKKGSRRREAEKKKVSGKGEVMVQRRFEGVNSREDLGGWLWGAADILRGAVRAEDYQDFMLPLLFFKRLSDEYRATYEEMLKEYRDREVAGDSMFYRAVIPDGCFWEDVRATSVNVGQKLNDVLNDIARAG